MGAHLTDKIISGYLDNLIADEEMHFVRQHVAECRQCAERLAQFSLLDETIAEMDPQAVEDAVFRQVRTRVLREVARRQREARRVLVPWWFNVFSTRALAYAGVTLVLVASVVFFTTDRLERSESIGIREEVAQRPDLGSSNVQVASAAAQLEFYQKATGFVATTAKRAYSSASVEAKSLGDGSQAVVAGKLAQLSQKSSGLIATAKTTASGLTEAIGDQSSRALGAAAKQALPQAGIAAGTTLIQLLGSIG
jgi:predicted anti-sigma-YlaC factor YlaD